VHRGAHPCWPWSTGVQKIKLIQGAPLKIEIANITIIAYSTGGGGGIQYPLRGRAFGARVVRKLIHLNALPPPLNNYKETLGCSPSTPTRKTLLDPYPNMLYQTNVIYQ
jgi:hypothetical protein